MKRLKFGRKMNVTEPPVTWKTVWMEFKIIVDLTFFLVISSYVYNLMFPMSMIFVGRLGTTYLDAVGLGNTIFNAFGILIFNGAMTGCDTTMSQSYGTKNKKMVGVYFQKGLLLYGGMILVCQALIINSETILVSLGQDREVSRLAGQYVSVLSVALPGFGIYMLTLRYFRIQNIIWPAITAGMLAVVLTIAGHYLFVNVLGYGILGSAYAQIIAYWTSALAAVLVTPCQRRVVRETWSGFTMDSLQDWGKFSTLSLAGIFIICLQWWGLEICTLLAGTIGKIELAAQTIVFQINYFIYTIPICVGIGCNISIGQRIGGNMPNLARWNMRIGWVFTWVLSAVNVIVLLSLRDLIPTLFTTEPEVIELTSETTVYLAIYHVFECTVTASLGMCRGIARQKMGSVVSFIGYYLIGIPTAVGLTFQLDMGLKGLWIGLSVGLAFESVLILYILSRTDWKAECRAAQIRAGLDPDEEKRNYENSDDEDTALIGRAGGTESFRKRFNAEHASSQTDVSVLATGKRLSGAQIVFYRGGYFAICFFILAVGIVLHFTFSTPYDMIQLCQPGNMSASVTTDMIPCA